MSGTNRRNAVAYGLSEALPVVFNPPIISNRAPLPKDKAPLGTIWIDKPNNDGFVLTSVVANVATWIGIGGGSGSFTDLTVTNSITAGGPITTTTGDLSAPAGNITCSGNIEGGQLIAETGSIVSLLGNITATTGNIIATAGNVLAVGGAVSGGGLFAVDDIGGTALTTSITNVTNTTQSTGALSIVSASANPGTNTGFIKVYIGTIPAFVPYFNTIAP